MIDDIIKDFKASLYERTASPLFVTFAASWSLWNYRLILAVLSSAELEMKLARLDKLVPIEWYERAWQFGIGPLATCLAFLFIYPFPARWVYQFWQTQQKILKETRQKIEDETPLTLAEARQIRTQFRELELRYKKDTDEKDASLNDLRTRLSLVGAQPGTPGMTPVEPLPLDVMQESKRLSKEGTRSVLSARRRVMIDLMRQMEDNRNMATENRVVAKSGLARSEALLALDELQQEGFIECHFDTSEDENIYRLVQKGRKLALEVKAESSETPPKE